ncbi:1392_t:CDS:2, partial [Gigaspora margarita]
MANESNKNIFDSIFSETHCELESLNNEISQLQDVYLTDYNSDKESDNEASEFIIDETSDETSDKASESIALAAALKRFQEIKAMTQYESNLFFLGIIDASMHVTEFKNGIPKEYLTTDYKFEGVTICQKAWYTIYDIQKRRWEALCTHYQNFGLTPKTHALTGHVSNFAISFLTTLNVLHFIANFANQHGLPSS